MRVSNIALSLGLTAILAGVFASNAAFANKAPRGTCVVPLMTFNDGTVKASEKIEGHNVTEKHCKQMCKEYLGDKDDPRCTWTEYTFPDPTPTPNPSPNK